MQTDLLLKQYKPVSEMTTENIQQPAPASPVEEKEFAKWLDQERNQGGSLWKSTEIWTRLNALETLYDIFRSRKELPSPVIGIGEQKREIPQMGYQLSAESDVAAIEYGKCLPVDHLDISAELTEAHEAGQTWMYRKAMEEILQLRAKITDLINELVHANEELAAFHPAPTPVVGEKYEEHIKEQNERLERVLNEAYDSVSNPAPTEQALPEEVGQWIDKEIKSHAIAAKQVAIAMYDKMQAKIDQEKRSTAMLFHIWCINHSISFEEGHTLGEIYDLYINSLPDAQ